MMVVFAIGNGTCACNGELEGILVIKPSDIFPIAAADYGIPKVEGDVIGVFEEFVVVLIPFFFGIL